MSNALRGAITWGVMSRVLDGGKPDDSEFIAIRDYLSGLGIPSADVEWMANSCPALSWAQLLYPRSK